MLPASGWLTQILSGLSQPLKWWVVIAPWERGILIRLGKTAKVLHPGIHLRIPFLDRVYVQSVRTRVLMESNQTITTKDKKVVTISSSIAFEIVDILRLYQKVLNPESIITSFASNAISLVVSVTNSNDLCLPYLEGMVNEKLATMEFGEWGLGQLRFMVTSFALVKTYRLLSNDYRTGSGLWNIEGENANERR